jgi:phospholipid-binding lipoprotein MlaA
MLFPTKILPVLLTTTLLAGCTTAHVGTDRLAERDPLEKFNRGIWSVNQGLDKVVMKPVTTVYRTVTPKPARQGITNFFSNLSEPWSMINNVLQGHTRRAAHNLARFIVNTTAGFGGLFDNATRAGITPAPEDLGQTFAAWGMNGGPYLMLPLFGPSTMRDGIGFGIAQFADPYGACKTYCGLPRHVPLALTGVQLLSIRSGLMDSGADAFLESSLDPYAAARSAYLQTRRAEILNQEGDEAAAEAAAAADAEANPIGPETAAPPKTAAPALSAPAETPASPPPASPQ